MTERVIVGLELPGDVQQKMIEFSRYYKIPELLFGLFLSNMKVVNQIFNFVDEIDYVDKGLLDTLIKLVQNADGSIPNLDFIFALAAKLDESMNIDPRILIPKIKWKATKKSDFKD